MTDQDNLRDRIAAVLYYRSMYFAVNKRTWGEEMEGTEGMSDAIDGFRDDAQEIIDELGLTVETVEGVMDPDGDYDTARVVGKWEKQ